MVVEGTEPLLADRALALIEARIFPADDMRTLNVERFDAPALESIARVEAAVNALAFLAPTRLVVVRGAHQLRVAARRELWAVAEAAPAGNTLVIEDLMPQGKKTKPESFGQLAGRAALRIDTTATTDVRTRFIVETLAQLGASADAPAIAALAGGEAELAAIKNDLEKLALDGKRITLADLAREALGVDDHKAYEYASALVAGRTAEALAVAFDLFANDPRGAAVPLLSALATEFALLWELARPGGELPQRMRWRERVLRPIATRLGERRARWGFERAVRGFEAVVTGRVDDPRGIIEMLTSEVATALA